MMLDGDDDYHDDDDDDDLSPSAPLLLCGCLIV